MKLILLTMNGPQRCLQARRTTRGYQTATNRRIDISGLDQLLIYSMNGQTMSYLYYSLMITLIIMGVFISKKTVCCIGLRGETA